MLVNLHLNVGEIDSININPKKLNCFVAEVILNFFIKKVYFLQSLEESSLSSSLFFRLLTKLLP